MNMKWILLSVCGCPLLFTTGCLSSSEEWRGHAVNVLYVADMMPTPPFSGNAPSGKVRQLEVIPR
jgi:hypothetical protein